jgi:hypothetical protein
MDVLLPRRVYLYYIVLPRRVYLYYMDGAGNG